MRTVGLWIDLQKAVIVSDAGRGVEIEFVNSDIDSHPWQLDVWKLPAPLRHRMSTDKLERFYKSVSGCVLDAGSIHIFGPCDAKSHLEERLRSDKYTRPISVESAGKMAESQIVNQVRARFANDYLPEALDISIA